MKNIVLGALGVCMMLQVGCVSRTQGLFTKPELNEFHRYAVLGLSLEHEQIFMATFLKVFGKENIVFVERNLLSELLREQDLYKVGNRLNDATRAKMKEILGVEALILCDYYDVGVGKTAKKFRVRIVNCETGEIVGSVITQAGDNFERHCVSAITALYRDLN